MLNVKWLKCLVYQMLVLLLLLDQSGLKQDSPGLRGRFPDFGKTTQCSQEMQMHRGEGGSHSINSLYCIALFD